MKKQTHGGSAVGRKLVSFRFLDGFYLFLIIFPLFLGILINVLTEPAAEGIVITGARIYFRIPLPGQALPITEAQVNSALVLISIYGACRYLTHGLCVRPQNKRQLIAEYLAHRAERFVSGGLGENAGAFVPFIAAILVLSACSSLLALIGLYPPTADINVVGGWAILVFLLITGYKLKNGLFAYLRQLAKPFPLFAPFNVVSELAVPVSMSFRHYGNILSGVVISTLAAAGLQIASAWIFGWLPGMLGGIPWLQIGIPAILSVYFDLFSGCLQAFIFAMLTLVYLAGAGAANRNRK